VAVNIFLACLSVKAIFLFLQKAVVGWNRVVLNASVNNSA